MADSALRTKGTEIEEETKDEGRLSAGGGVFTVSVMVRGEVTLRSLETWRKLLQRVKLPLQIHDLFSQYATYIVLDSSCEVNRFLSWSKLSEIPDKEAVHLVTPAWLISSLQKKCIEDWTSYLHPLQKEHAPSHQITQETPSGSMHSSSPPAVVPSTQPTSAPSETAKFACQRTTAGEHNLNSHLTSPLESLLEHYELQHDDFRAKAYKRAIGKLKHLDFRVTDLSQVIH